MRIMGLDYGSKTVGVAVSDALLLTAQNIETICREQENKLRRTLARIQELCLEYEVEEIEMCIRDRFQCLPKGDKMELIIQKAVELGASRIVPVASKRCVVRLDEKKAQSKVKRWQAIAESAAKQSGRAVVPEVKLSVSYREAMKLSEELDVKLIPYECADELLSGTEETPMERTLSLIHI